MIGTERRGANPIVPAAVRPAESAESALVAKVRKLKATANITGWDLADAYLELKRLGWTVRKIAQKCDSNKDSVSRFIRCAEVCIPRDTRPPFWEVYRDIKKPEHEQEVTEDDSCTVTKAAGETPKEGEPPTSESKPDTAPVKPI